MESLTKRGETFDMTNWTLRCEAKVPRQTNGYDCGVFEATFAERICADQKLTFTQDDIPKIGEKMCMEILEGQIRHSSDARVFRPATAVNRDVSKFSMTCGKEHRTSPLRVVVLDANESCSP